jgi:hypothetical protein
VTKVKNSLADLAELSTNTPKNVLKYVKRVSIWNMVAKNSILTLLVDNLIVIPREIRPLHPESSPITNLFSACSVCGC